MVVLGINVPVEFSFFVHHALLAGLRWDEKVESPITDGVKLPVINALYGAITVDKEIDLEEA